MERYRVAIHQPNYFPWLGYFLKISICHKFIFLDDVQFSRDGFTKRTLIRKNIFSNECKYLSVPVQKMPLTSSVNQILISTKKLWINDHINSIVETYRKSRYFDHYMPFTSDLLLRGFHMHQDLASFNVFLISEICALLGLRLESVRASELRDTARPKFGGIIELLEISGANEYLSGKGASAYNDMEYFTGNQCDCRYVDLMSFLAKRNLTVCCDFLPTLSIIDALMNIGVDGINEIFVQFKAEF